MAILIKHTHLSFFLLSLLILSCAPQQIPIEKQCTTDLDCVAETCCHPTNAINKNYAPDCRELACTLSCEPDTLDCGQGEIKCIKGQCQAIITK